MGAGCEESLNHRERGGPQGTAVREGSATISTLACCCRLPQSALQICRQQSMKQLFTRLAPHRQPAGSIGTRLQAALHRLADAQIFVLHTVSHRYTLLVISSRRLAYVAEVEIENYTAMVDVYWNYQIRIQIT